MRQLVRWGWGSGGSWRHGARCAARAVAFCVHWVIRRAGWHSGCVQTERPDRVQTRRRRAGVDSDAEPDWF